jgi:hypothetical protein
VVALSKGGENIPTQGALDHVFGYAVGLDMTRRDLQAEAKKAGRPWEVSKAFEGRRRSRQSCRQRDRPSRCRSCVAGGQRRKAAGG